MSVRYGRRIPGPLKLKVWYSTWLAVLACHFLVIALGSLLLSVLTLPLISDRRPLEEEDDDDDGDGDDGDHEDDMRTTRVDAVNVNCLKLLRACAHSALCTFWLRSEPGAVPAGLQGVPETGKYPRVMPAMYLVLPAWRPTERRDVTRGKISWGFLNGSNYI